MTEMGRKTDLGERVHGKENLHNIKELKCLQEAPPHRTVAGSCVDCENIIQK